MIAEFWIHKPVWSSRYPAESASDYSTRVYSAVEEELDAALDGILSVALREEEVRGEEIDTMNADLVETDGSSR